MAGEPPERSRAVCDLAAAGRGGGIDDPTLLLSLDLAVRHHAGEDCGLERVRPVGGGSIHRAYVLECGRARCFAKINDASQADNFAAEIDGLEALREAGIRAPQPWSTGTVAGAAFLVLEHLELGSLVAGAGRVLGRALATLHARDAGTRFGWRRANYIGSTPQSNAWHDEWPSFWSRERLAPQLALAARKGLGERLQALGERLLARVPELLDGHAPKPALVHGDLWSGNAGTLVSGEPVVFDPAVYVGDAEVDLAMTELFGGFPADFYAGYAEVMPRASGREARKPLYNLYHVLNHANLFGGGYVAQAEHMMARLVGR